MSIESSYMSSGAGSSSYIESQWVPMQLSGRKLMKDIRKRAAIHIQRVIRGAIVRVSAIRASIGNPFPHVPYQIQQPLLRQAFRLQKYPARYRGSMSGRKRHYHDERFGYIRRGDPTHHNYGNLRLADEDNIPIYQHSGAMLRRI